MSSLWRAIRGYILWTHPRGNVHYDVMVTLILAFIFLTPAHWFHDKPVEHTPHNTEVVVAPDPSPSNPGGFLYRVAPSAISAANDGETLRSLERVIEPIAGPVELTRWEALRDGHGHITEYRAWGHRTP